MEAFHAFPTRSASPCCRLFDSQRKSKSVENDAHLWFNKTMECRLPINRKIIILFKLSGHAFSRDLRLELVRKECFEGTKKPKLRVIRFYSNFSVFLLFCDLQPKPLFLLVTIFSSSGVARTLTREKLLSSVCFLHRNFSVSVVKFLTNNFFFAFDFCVLFSNYPNISLKNGCC